MITLDVKEPEKLTEIRCTKCNRKLAEQQIKGKINIKCPRCNHVNRVSL